MFSNKFTRILKNNQNCNCKITLIIYKINATINDIQYTFDAYNTRFRVVLVALPSFEVYSSFLFCFLFVSIGLVFFECIVYLCVLNEYSLYNEDEEIKRKCFTHE